MDHLRSASLRGFRSVVAEFGGDADMLARLVGLPPTCLDTDDMMVPAARAAGLLDVAAEHLDCPDLGLRMAERQSASVLGPLAVAITNSPTIEHALACLSRYLFVHGRSLTLRLEDDPYRQRDVTALRYGPAGPGGPIQAVDLGLGFIHRLLNSLHGGHYRLHSVELPYHPRAEVSTYREWFGAPVHAATGYGAAYLRFPRELPRAPLTGVNDTYRQLALAFLSQQAGTHGRDVVSRVRTAVQESLGTGQVDLAAIAALLTTHPRTLQRDLRAEGTTFGRIVDECRRETALRLVVGTELSFGQIGSMVGFADHPSFTRAARRWWDCTPRELRHGQPDSR